MAYINFCCYHCWLVIEALGCTFLAKKYTLTGNIGTHLIIGMIGLLYSALTPFCKRRSSNANLLHEKAGNGYRWGQVPLLLLRVWYIKLLWCYLRWLWCFGNYLFQSSVSNFSFLTIIGLTTNLTFVLLILFFAINEKATDKCLRAIIKFLYRIKL